MEPAALSAIQTSCESLTQTRKTQRFPSFYFVFVLSLTRNRDENLTNVGNSYHYSLKCNFLCRWNKYKLTLEIRSRDLILVQLLSPIY